MKPTYVVWKSYEPGVMARGYWDMATLEACFNGSLWRVPMPLRYVSVNSFADVPPSAEGCVMVLKANAEHPHTDRINEDLARFKWALVILAGDEGGEFPWRKIEHPNMKLWVLAPRVGIHEEAGRLIGEGWPTDTRLISRGLKEEYEKKSQDWFFSGQITHIRREELVRELERMEGGTLVKTEGFAQGLAYPEYLRRMADAKIVPCASGIQTPDSFRFFEALEMGCVPIADNISPDADHKPGYWEMTFPGAPFPIINQWHELPGLMADLLSEWPYNANRIFGWWQQYKRQLAYNMRADILEISNHQTEMNDMADRLTVLMPTSVIPSHPGTEIIEETVASVRAQLPDCEIIVMIDGLRAQQEDRKDDYALYVRKLLWMCNNEWTNVVPIVFEAHTHQANMTRKALELVTTPQVLFVEHDTPIMGSIDWNGLSWSVGHGIVNHVRLHYDQSIHPEHEHMMCSGVENTKFGVPIIRTMQWSQRPHLASTEYYRRVIRQNFGHEASTMIEDVMHSVVANSKSWDDHRLAIYAPEGGYQRSRTSDGRGDDPKFEMVYRYDGPVPEGAPAPN